MIVMKFDAGSIGSADRLRAVARLVQQHKAKKPVVVTSALPKVTDLLLRGGARGEGPAAASTKTGSQELKDVHEEVVAGSSPEGPPRRRLLGHT